MLAEASLSTSTPATESAPHGVARRIYMDMTIVVAVTAITAIVFVQFDVSEMLYGLTRNFEWGQFDEVPGILLALACASMWFAARRYRDATTSFAQQRAIDARLAYALEENRRLAQQYVSLQESERKTLARELHDEMGQYLNAIKIDAVAIRDRSAIEESIRQDANTIIRNADHVYSVVAEWIRRLRPVGLDDLGLVAAIEHSVEQWQQRFPNLRFVFAADGDLSELGEQANLVVYRITQEALTNAVKHAKATAIDIQLSVSMASDEAKVIRLNIKDNGVGADLTTSSKGFGLISMRERVQMQGGSFVVQSTPGNGFAISVQFVA